MKQAVMTAPGRIEFQDVPVPKPRPGEVLLRVNRIGVCGSDVHVYHGEHQYVKYPLIQGHELAAEIAELGEQVRGFSVGQKVTIQPQVYCGRCYQCTHGSYHICENLKVMGFQLPGCAREFLSVPAEKLIELPAELSLDQGALIEPVAVAVHAIGRAASIRGKRVLVLGAGGAGAAAVVAALAAGASRVSVRNRTGQRASDLVSALADPRVSREHAEPDPGDWDLVIQATSLGLEEADPLPLSLSGSKPGNALDLVYRPGGTAWVHHARACGWSAEDGLGVLLEQGVLSLGRWLDSPIPPSVRSAMEDALVTGAAP